MPITPSRSNYVGIYYANTAAGSYDNGFMVTLSLFSGYDGSQSPTTSTYSAPLYAAIQSTQPCTISKGDALTLDLSSITAFSMFYDNEAMGCRVGVMVVNRKTRESFTSTCAVISGIKSWRNGHIGMILYIMVRY